MSPLTLSAVVALVATAHASAAGPAEPAARVRRFALIAGSNQADPTRVPLQFATSDAEAFARVLEELGGVSPKDQILLRDPSAAQLRRALGRLRIGLTEAAEPGVRREVVLYYSGHSDESGLLLGRELYPYLELRQTLNDLPADVRIAVLDSCASGALTRSKGGRHQRPFVIDVSAQVKGHAILTSAAATESAQESERLGASFFTHYLVSGLRGAADISGDGRVTLTEAYQFAFHETLARTEGTLSGPQHANYDIQLAGSGDLVMTDLRSTSSGLVLDLEAWGRVFVRDDEGRLIAELDKRAGAPLEVGVGPGLYRLTLEQDTAFFRSEVQVRKGERADVSSADWIPTERERFAVRGGAASPATEIAARTQRIERNRARHGHPFGPPTPQMRDEDEEEDLEDALENALDEAEDDPPGVIVATLVPGLSLPREASQRPRRLSFNLLYGKSPRVNGVEVGAINHTGVELRGLQLGLANLNDGRLRGTQIALGPNLTRGGGYGAQLSGLFNIGGGGLSGLQFAGVFNVDGGDARLWQVSSAFNVHVGNLEGVQATGGLNWLGGDLLGGLQAAPINVVTGAAQGVQLGSAFNYAGSLHGGQLALLNVGGELDGVQVGLVNVATGKVRGSQVGMLNIAADYEEGFPVGPLNIVRDGQFHVDTWASNMFLANLSLRFGSENVYTMFSAGYSPIFDGEPGRAALGFGVGGMLTLVAGLYLGADLSYLHADWKANSPDKIRLFQGDSEHVAQLRVIAGYRFHERFGVFVGGGVNGVLTFDGTTRPQIGGIAVASLAEGDFRARFWPGVFGGVSF